MSTGLIVTIGCTVLTVIGGLIGAWISSKAQRSSYHETSEATLKSSRLINSTNSRNMYIAQYNNLFERTDKLEDELYQAQRDSIRNSSDELIFYQLLKKAVAKLDFNHIQVSPETKHFLANITKKLKQDSQNSL